MWEHHRRIHGDPRVDDAVGENRSCGDTKDQTELSSREGTSSLSASFLKRNDSAPEVGNGFTAHQRGTSETTLQVLRAEIDGLKARREQAVRTFDEEIDAMNTSLRIMERRAQSAGGKE